MNLKALFLLVAVVLSGLLPTGASRTITHGLVRAFQSSAQAQAAQPVEIPFELANRHIMLKVNVNSRPLTFVLDTGDRYAIINLDRAKELGLKLQGEVRIGGAGAGRQTGAFVKDSTFTIPGVPGFSQALNIAVPISRLSQGLGLESDGIIGFDFIKEFVLEIDYLKRVIRLHDKDKFVYSGPGESIPIDLKSSGQATGHPVVDAEVTIDGGAPIKGKYMLDIGSGGALALHSPFVKEHRILRPERKTVRAFGAGAGGDIKGRLGRVSELKIGKFKFSNPVTLFSEDAQGAFANPDLAGNIGAQITSKFKVFLDYSRNRIIFEPNTTYPEAFERSSAGLRIYAEGPEFRIFRIKDLLEDSPASEAGLQQGDIISAIDGRPASEFTLTKVNEMFERPVAYNLTVRRGEQTINVKLTPRKLV